MLACLCLEPGAASTQLYQAVRDRLGGGGVGGGDREVRGGEKREEVREEQA